MSLVIPDLRFEQGFYRSLEGYAAQANTKGKKMRTKGKPAISLSVVAYAIIKDQVVMTFLQGFLWTGILLLAGPTRNFLIRQGQKTGLVLYNLLGLGNFGKNAVVGL